MTTCIIFPFSGSLTDYTCDSGCEESIISPPTGGGTGVQCSVFCQQCLLISEKHLEVMQPLSSLAYPHFP